MSVAQNLHLSITSFYCALRLASWQHCIDYNTASAGLSQLGATPAAQVSGGTFPPSSNQKKKPLLKHSYISTSFPPSSSPNCTEISVFQFIQRTVARVHVGVPFEELLPKLGEVHDLSQRLGHLRHSPCWHINNLFNSC